MHIFIGGLALFFFILACSFIMMALRLSCNG